MMYPQSKSTCEGFSDERMLWSTYVLSKSLDCTVSSLSMSEEMYDTGSTLISAVWAALPIAVEQDVLKCCVSGKEVYPVPNVECQISSVTKWLAYTWNSSKGLQFETAASALCTFWMHFTANISSSCTSKTMLTLESKFAKWFSTPLTWWLTVNSSMSSQSLAFVPSCLCAKSVYDKLWATHRISCVYM